MNRMPLGTRRKWSTAVSLHRFHPVPSQKGPCGQGGSTSAWQRWPLPSYWRSCCTRVPATRPCSPASLERSRSLHSGHVRFCVPAGADPAQPGGPGNLPQVRAGSSRLGCDTPWGRSAGRTRGGRWSSGAATRALLLPAGEDSHAQGLAALDGGTVCAFRSDAGWSRRAREERERGPYTRRVPPTRHAM